VGEAKHAHYGQGFELGQQETDISRFKNLFVG